MKTLYRVLLLSSGLLSVSCATAADSQKRSDVAQRQADTKIAAANSERIDKNRAAQAKADLEIAAADAAFTTHRVSYRGATLLELVALDADIAELEAKHRAAKGALKAELEASLAAIRSSRARYTTSRSELEGVGASEWDAAKRDLDAQWAALKALVARG
jgi:hypothetical protein